MTFKLKIKNNILHFVILSKFSLYRRNINVFKNKENNRTFLFYYAKMKMKIEFSNITKKIKILLHIINLSINLL